MVTIITLQTLTPNDVKKKQDQIFWLHFFFFFFLQWEEVEMRSRSLSTVHGGDQNSE